MNKKYLCIALAMLLLVAAAALAGCGGASNEPDEEDGMGNDAIQEETDWNDPEEIEALLGKYEDFPGATYRCIITVPGVQPVEQRVWVTPAKIRSEMTHPQGSGELLGIVDLEAGLYYSYDSMSGIAIQYGLGKGHGDIPTPKAYADDVSVEDMDYARREVFDGKDCIVYDFEMGGTMWVWEKYGTPLKIVSKVEGSEVTVEFLEFEYGPVPDEMFELPPGATIMDLGDLGVTGGL